MATAGGMWALLTSCYIYFSAETAELDLDGQEGKMFLRVLLNLIMHNYPSLVSGSLQLLFKHFSQRREVLQAFRQVRVLLNLIMHNYPSLVSGSLQLLFKHFSQRREVLQAFRQVRLLTLIRSQKCLTSRDPTDPSFLGPTLNFEETSENFLFQFLGCYEWFSCFFYRKKNLKILLTLKNIETFPEKIHWSRNRRFPTMWYVRPAKPRISLRIRAVWPEPLLVI